MLPGLILTLRLICATEVKYSGRGGEDPNRHFRNFDERMGDGSLIYIQGGGMRAPA